jgi:catalase (peroxidase I)
MGRIYWDPDQPGGRPDPLAQDVEAIRQGLATAYSATAVTQAETVAFLVQYGGDVTKGHAPVGAPGRMGDPDNPVPDAADNG